MKKLISLVAGLLIGSCLFAEQIDYRSDKTVTEIELGSKNKVETTVPNTVLLPKKEAKKIFKFIKKLEKKADWTKSYINDLLREETIIDGWIISRAKLDNWPFEDYITYAITCKKDDILLCYAIDPKGKNLTITVDFLYNHLGYTEIGIPEL